MNKRWLWSVLLVLLVACGDATPPPSVAPTNVADATPSVEFATPAPTAVPLAVTIPAAPDPLPETFSGQNALVYAATQMQWVHRDVGTPGWQATGDWIVDTLHHEGWNVEERFFPTPEGTRGRNIIASRGTGPLVLIGAHYDSRRFADMDPDATKQQQPVPAANDGASGVAVLLELARVLKPERLNEQVWLVFFDAEDNGDINGWGWTLGSQSLAPQLPEAPAAVVVVDMIGDADQQIYYEHSSNEALRQEIWQVAADLGYTSFKPELKHSLLDDHTAFAEKGYPAIDIIDFDYAAWHTTADTLDKLSAASLESVGRTLEVWLTEKR